MHFPTIWKWCRSPKMFVECTPGEKRQMQPLKFPASAEDLRRAGYIDQERSKFCVCGEVVFWFLTPAAKWMPMAIDLDGRWTPHWSTCRAVKSEKKLELKKQAERQGQLFR